MNSAPPAPWSNFIAQGRALLDALETLDLEVLTGNLRKLSSPQASAAISHLLELGSCMPDRMATVELLASLREDSKRRKTPSVPPSRPVDTPPPYSPSAAIAEPGLHATPAHVAMALRAATHGAPLMRPDANNLFLES
jgi:hypothetical protein